MTPTCCYGTPMHPLRAYHGTVQWQCPECLACHWRRGFGSMVRDICHGIAAAIVITILIVAALVISSCEDGSRKPRPRKNPRHAQYIAEVQR